MAKRSGLGKGLDALFMDNNTEDGAVVSLRVSEMEPNRRQPRVLFTDQALQELADSIRRHGVLQPLVVRPLDSGGYQIVAGERRWRASRMAGLSAVPAIIRQLDDSQALEIAIIENLQREDLNVMELAQGYLSLIEEHGMTQEQVAEKLGISRPVVANTIRLLQLPEKVRELVRNGKISRGHAKALLSLEDPTLIEQVAQQAAQDNILVRDIEKMARDRKKQDESATPDKPVANTAKEKIEELLQQWTKPDYREMALALSNELGRKVTVKSKGEKRGVLEIEFYSDYELNELAAKLMRAEVQ